MITIRALRYWDLLGCFSIHGDGEKAGDQVFRGIITSFDTVQCDLCHGSRSFIIYMKASKKIFKTDTGRVQTGMIMIPTTHPGALILTITEEKNKRLPFRFTR